jgi:hypothetical protein
MKIINFIVQLIFKVLLLCAIILLFKYIFNDRTSVVVKMGLILINSFFIIILIYKLQLLNFGLFIEKNKTPVDTQAAISKMFNLAHKQIRIFSGQLRKDFFTPDIINLFKKKVEELSKKRILLDGQKSVEIILSYKKFNLELVDIKFLTWIISNPNIDLYWCGDDVNNHFLVIDNEHTRVELIHKSWDDFRPAKLHYYDPLIAMYFIDKFNKIKDNSKKISNINELYNIPLANGEKWPAKPGIDKKKTKLKAA